MIDLSFSKPYDIRFLLIYQQVTNKKEKKGDGSIFI